MALNSCKEKTQTQQAIDDFNHQLTEVTLANAEANCVVADHLQQGTCRAAKDAAANFDLAQAGYENYQAFKGGVVTSAHQDVSELYNHICFIQDTLKKNVDDNLKKTVGSIKELAKQVKAVNSAICAVETEYNDTCNSKQLSILQERVPIGDSRCWDTVEEMCMPPGIDQEIETEFEVYFKKIGHNGEALTRSLNHLKDIAVKVSSLNARLNLEGVKVVSEALKGNAKELEEDIKNNLAFYEKEVKENCDSLATSRQEDSATIFKERTSYTHYKSLQLLLDLTKTAELAEDQNWESIDSSITDKMACK